MEHTTVIFLNLAATSIESVMFRESQLLNYKGLFSGTIDLCCFNLLQILNGTWNLDEEEELVEDIMWSLKLNVTLKLCLDILKDWLDCIAVGIA